MAHLFAGGKFQAIGSAGLALPGALLYTYAAGGLVPLATYTDQGGLSANANPVVCDAAGQADVWLGTSAYRMILKTAAGVTVWDVDNISANASSADLLSTAADRGADLIGLSLANQNNPNTVAGFLQTIYGRTTAETSAAVTPSNYAYAPLNVRRYGAALDNSTDDTAEITSALSVADETVSGAQGNQIDVPQGTAVVSSTINIPNRVSIKGANKRGSVFKAAAAHPGPYMFTVDNGTSSMFDNALQNVTIDCNSVASLSGVLSDAWQEGGGMRDVLINNVRAYGVRFQNGDGGAALCEIKQSEIFGSSVAAGTAGIRVDLISATGSFLLRVSDSTIAGGSGGAFPRGIDMVNDSLHAHAVHFETCTSAIYLDGVGHHVLVGVTGAASVTNLVEIASTFTGTLRMIGCFRAGSTNLLVDNRVGGLGTISGYDTDIHIASTPTLGPGQESSCGWLEMGNAAYTIGNPVAPQTAGSTFNVATFTKNAVGDFTITETRGRPSAASAVPWGITNLATSGTHVRTDLVGANSYRIRVYVAGVLTDCSELKFGCKRLA